MINKQSLWFLTLFSLILVLSVYYVTMPKELLLTNNSNFNDETKEVNKEDDTNNANVNVDVKESDILVALRVEKEEQTQKEIDDLNKVIVDQKANSDEKNNAYEQLKILNMLRGQEEAIETKIKEIYKLNAFVKIDNNQVRIVIGSNTHDVELANNIMRTVQDEFKNKMYISVKFQS